IAPALADPPRVELPKPPKVDSGKFAAVLGAKPPARPPVKSATPADAIAPEPLASPELAKIAPPAPAPITTATATAPPSPALASEIGKAARHTATGQTSLVRAL